jgi:hypothetical protein
VELGTLANGVMLVLVQEFVNLGNTQETCRAVPGSCCCLSGGNTI